MQYLDNFIGLGFTNGLAMNAANRQNSFDKGINDDNNQAALQRAMLSLGGQNHAVDVGAATTARGQDLQNSQYLQTLAANNSNAGADRDLSRYQSDQSAGVATHGQDTSLQASLAGSAAQRYTADQNAGANRYASDQQLAAAKLPWDYKTGLLNQFGGAFTGALSALGNASFNPQSMTPAVAAPVAPNLNATGAGSAYQAQAQVDRAKNEQTGANRKLQSNADLGGRGFGAGSPLAMALNAGIDTGTQVANADADASARTQAAQINAQQQNAGAQIAAQQYADYQTALANAQKIGLGYYGQNSTNQSNILAQLSGLLG